MFAAATREVVFSNPEVIRRISRDFIPVALKAGQVNHPPAGVEGALYAEIRRSQPAPQGIGTVNSSGKVLSWALSFDDDQAILQFLDHVLGRYRNHPGAGMPVAAFRYRRFPGQALPEVADTGRRIAIPESHPEGELCPAQPTWPPGTLVGRVVGRVLDEQGRPRPDTLRQEHYMEARFDLTRPILEELAGAAEAAGGDRFGIPPRLARALVETAFLGQLDVNPLGTVPGSRNDYGFWVFHGQAVASGEEGSKRIRLTGHSRVEGGQDRPQNLAGGDGRFWEHTVSLAWQGYLDLRGGEVTRLDLLAEGHERLRWGNANMARQWRLEPDAAHLMAGHPIDLDTRVRYGLTAERRATEASTVREER